MQEIDLLNVGLRNFNSNKSPTTGGPPPCTHSQFFLFFIFQIFRGFHLVKTKTQLSTNNKSQAMANSMPSTLTMAQKFVNLVMSKRIVVLRDVGKFTLIVNKL